MATRGATVYERVDSWYSDGAKKSGGGVRLIQLWIAIPYSGDFVALGHPFIEVRLVVEKISPEILTPKA